MIAALLFFFDIVNSAGVMVIFQDFFQGCFHFGIVLENIVEAYIRNIERVAVIV